MLRGQWSGVVVFYSQHLASHLGYFERSPQPLSKFPGGHPGWGPPQVHTTKLACQHIGCTTLSSAHAPWGRVQSLPTLMVMGAGSHYPSLCQCKRPLSSSNSSHMNGSKGGGHSRSSAGKASPSSAGVDQLQCCLGALSLHAM